MVCAVSVYVKMLFQRNDEILLIRRAQTGSYDGFYACVGGNLDPDESVLQSIIRESFEEVGVTIEPQDCHFVHVVHEMRDGRNLIGFVFRTDRWSGELYNKEPHKHDDMRWFKITALPDNIHPVFRHVIEMVQRNKQFSTQGFSESNSR